MLHIIKNQIIQLKLTDRNNAFLIQHEFHNFYWNKIVPELERIFDQLSNEKEIIRIDHLELELGVLQLSQLTSAGSLAGINAKIFAAIKEEVRRCLEQKHKDNNGVGIIMQWLHYMEKGYLDWNTMSTGTEWYRRVLEGLATDYNSISLLRRLIQSDKNALQRITIIHDDVFLIHLAEVLSATKQKVLHEFIRDLDKVFSFFPVGKQVMDFTDRKIIKQKVWERIIGYAAQQREGLSSEGLVIHAINWLVTQEKHYDWVELITKVRARTFLYFLVEKMGGKHGFKRKESKKQIEEPGMNTGHEPGNKKSRGQQDRGQNKTGESGKTKKLKSPDSVLQELTRIRHDEASDIQDIYKEPVIDEIFASLAGLVLLHPFLTTLFSRLSLLQEGKFVDESSQKKAVHILYYLATGNEEPEEFELLIPKFLAGYPLQKLIPPICLLQQEKEESDSLLEAVIGKWKIIGHTSPTGLRESFLQRKGKLYTRDEKLYLHLETSSIDVLLDHLPWNLSILKLPWMKELLRVEWR